MTSPRQVDYAAVALQLFDEICRQFSLSYTRDHKAPVEVCLIVPKQEGLDFEVVLMLQNIDKLWLCTDNFTMSLFPCRKDRVVAHFKENAVALLSGKARIVECRVKGFGLCASSLETFDGVVWKHSYGYGRGFGFLVAKMMPWLVSKTIVANSMCQPSRN